MPEPLLYAKACAAACLVSAAVWLLAAWLWKNPAWIRGTGIAAIAAGLVAGYYTMSLRVVWPPASALDRLLVIVLPLALMIEWVAGERRLPRGSGWLLRGALAAATPGILLAGSVYLSGSDSGWSLNRTLATCLLCSGTLVGVWWSLTRLSQAASTQPTSAQPTSAQPTDAPPATSLPALRTLPVSGDLSVVGSVVLCLLCASVTIMVAGYIKGGAAALPLAASLTGAAAAGIYLRRSLRSDGRMIDAAAILGIGLWGLFGLLFIGHFFGRLSAGSAMVMLLAPLLGWLSELPVLRTRRAWVKATVQLALVGIALAGLLVLAKAEFDRELAPLL